MKFYRNALSDFFTFNGSCSNNNLIPGLYIFQIYHFPPPLFAEASFSPKSKRAIEVFPKPIFFPKVFFLNKFFPKPNFFPQPLLPQSLPPSFSPPLFPISFYPLFLFVSPFFFFFFFFFLFFSLFPFPFPLFSFTPFLQLDISSFFFPGPKMAR